MANRRSLTEVLDVPPQQRKFIQNGMAVGAASEPPSEEESASLPDEEEVTEPAASVVNEQPQGRTRSKRPPKVTAAQGDEIPFGFANLLVPVTTKLRPATAAALKRAGLEQKLRGQVPSTVQEIAEVAIQGWLHGAGYLK